MATIQTVHAREILDARGQPTIECSILLDNGIYGTSCAPSGTSVGKYEALDLRDKEQRMGGMGVHKAVDNINTIIGPAIVGKDPAQQEELDQLMISLDGTEKKSKLGGNAIIAVSQTVI